MTLHYATCEQLEMRGLRAYSPIWSDEQRGLRLVDETAVVSSILEFSFVLSDEGLRVEPQKSHVITALTIAHAILQRQK